MKHYLYIILLSALIVGYESYAQLHNPEMSIMAAAGQSFSNQPFSPLYRPSRGIWQILGWSGSLLICLTLFYSVRKRVRYFKKWGTMKQWLNLHIFMGILGPLFILFHTTFKFGGLIGIGFWSMVLVVLSGVIGRYIYAQIPRGIKGNELSLKEIEKESRFLSEELQSYFSPCHRRREKIETKSYPPYSLSLNGKGCLLCSGSEVAVGRTEPLGMEEILEEITAIRPGKKFSPFPALFFMLRNDLKNIWVIFRLKREIRKAYSFSPAETSAVIKLLSRKAWLIRKIHFLSLSRQLLDYWHILHKPLCVILFLTMFLHIAVYFLFKA